MFKLLSSHLGGCLYKKRVTLPAGNMCLLCRCHYLSTWVKSIYRCLCLYWAQPSGRWWQVTLQVTHNYTQATFVLQSLAQRWGGFLHNVAELKLKLRITCCRGGVQAQQTWLCSVFSEAWTMAYGGPIAHTHTHSHSNSHMLFMLCMWCVASGTWR